MKKVCLLAIAFLFIGLTPLVAYDSQEKALQEESQSNGWWPFLQVVFWPGMPPYTGKAVYGLRTGPIMSGGQGAVDGVELAPILGYSEYVYGVQCSAFMNHSKIAEGVRLGILNTSTSWTKGIQFGVVNSNFKNSTGFDLAIVNTTGKNMRGLQLGVANYAVNQKGVQFGILNISKWSGIQIGLVNIIENGWLPFLPFFNFSFQ